MLKTVVSTIAAIFLVAAVAVAEKGKTIDIYTNAILPDGQELKAGKYQVMVSQDEKEIQFLQSNKVVVKHACRCMGHDGAKHRYSQARYTEGSDKKQKLTDVRFAGSSCVLNLDVQPGM